MKPVCLLVFLILIVSCSPKSTSEPSVEDSTTVTTQDSIATQSRDTSSVAETTATPQPIKEVKAATKDPNKKTLQCKFQNFEPGDCPHIIFDCDDFGDAVIAALPKDQAEIWNNLIAFEDHGDFPVANPKYVGKTFEIVHTLVDGKSCNPAGGTTQVPNIVSFKIISN